MLAIQRIRCSGSFQVSNIMQAILWSFFPHRFPNPKKMPIIRIMLNTFQLPLHLFFPIILHPLTPYFANAEYGTASQKKGVYQVRLRGAHLQGFAPPVSVCSGAPTQPLHICAPSPADPDKTPFFW